MNPSQAHVCRSRKAASIGSSSPFKLCSPLPQKLDINLPCAEIRVKMIKNNACRTDCDMDCRIYLILTLPSCRPKLLDWLFVPTYGACCRNQHIPPPKSSQSTTETRFVPIYFIAANLLLLLVYGVPFPVSCPCF